MVFHAKNLMTSEFAAMVWDMVGMELCLFVLFSLGFYLFRSDVLWKVLVDKEKLWKKAMETDPDAQRIQELEANFASGQFECALKAWLEFQHLTLEILRILIQSALELKRQTEVV